MDLHRTIIPAKLKPGDTIRVIAPARSLGMIGQENRVTATKRLEDLGLYVTFGNHVDEIDEFNSSTIESRVADFHEAFRDPDVKAIQTVIGGFNSNQLLRYLDWDLIRHNPKIFCGYSDITALNNSIFAKTGLVSYSGPHYSTFGQKKHADYMIEYWKKCLFDSNPINLQPNPYWSDDAWWFNQDDRALIPNEGWWVINDGIAEGRSLGANLTTFAVLKGTEFFPSLKDSILFIEDDCEELPHHFDRTLQSLIHLNDFEHVKGILIGRFQKASKMTKDLLLEIINNKQELAHIPIIANLDFGHTNAMFTFPIGGKVKMDANVQNPSIVIVEH